MGKIPTEALHQVRAAWADYIAEMEASKLALSVKKTHIEHGLRFMRWLVTDPTAAALERRMRPGAWSTGGFLGRDEDLEQVLAGDAATLKQLGVTATEVARELGRVLDRVDGTVDGRFSVTTVVSAGFQSCPWARNSLRNDCPWGASDHGASGCWVIRNLSTGDRMAGPHLIVHLIAAHGFFEGIGSPYRVDPEHLCRLLGIAPLTVPPRARSHHARPGQDLGGHMLLDFFDRVAEAHRVANSHL
jgi:hypothetical protein